MTASALVALAWIVQMGLAWGWLRSVYHAPWTITGIQAWLEDPNNGGNREPIITVVGLVMAPAVAIASWLLGRVSTRDKSQSGDGVAVPGADAAWRRIRTALIGTVRRHWVDDFLSHSLYRGVRLKLCAENQDEVLVHPLGFERDHHSSAGLVNDSALLEEFDRNSGLFLILGQPGAGKTTILLQLTKLLLERAQSEPQAPVPLVVPLASWSATPKPLEDWLCNELMQLYGLSTSELRFLFTEPARLILMLDGLDEQPEQMRSLCVEAIEIFKTKYSCGMVVSCRTDEYRALSTKLKLRAALRIRPLTFEQADAYFAFLGTHFDGLRQILHVEPALRDLATTPFFLHVLTIVYGSDLAFTTTLKSSGAETWKDAVFQQYVRIALKRKAGIPNKGLGRKASYSKACAIHWLQEMSLRLASENRTDFHLERLQYSWSRSRMKDGLARSSVAAIPVGLLGAILLGANVGTLTAFSIGIICTGSFVVAGGVLFMFNPFTITPFDNRFLHLSWKHGLGAGMVFGVLGAFAGFLFVRYGKLFASPTMIASGFTDIPWPFFSITGAIAGIFAGGFQRRSNPCPTIPNQAIRRSLKAGLLGAFLIAGLAWLLAIATNGFPRVFIVCGSVFGFLLCGGDDFWAHYSLRLSLGWQRVLPFPLSDRKFVEFMDDMSRRMLLKRVGGGWVFIHRLFVEYLATKPFGGNSAAIKATLEKWR